MSPLKVGGLFAGIGGIPLAASWLGWETAWLSENDEAASAELARLFPGIPNHGDITRIRGKEIEPVDVLTGGFPCQDISLAGPGGGVQHGARSGLWRHFARLIDELQQHRGKPLEGVLAENVSAIRSRGLDIVLRDLDALGYDTQWHCLPAVAAGAHHRRDRAWIVARPRLASDAAWQAEQETLAHTIRTGLEGHARYVLHGARRPGSHGSAPPPGLLAGEDPAESWVVEPNVGDLVDRLPPHLAAQWPAGDPRRGLPLPRVSRQQSRRKSKLKQLGNTIAPVIAYAVLRGLDEVIRRAATTHSHN